MDTTAAEVTVAEVNAFAAEQLPFCAGLGLTCESVALDEAVVRWLFDRRWTRPVDFVCGPVMMAMADAAVYFACFTRGGVVALALTNELKTTFLRPAAGGGDLLCRARILKRGRKVIYALADIVEEASPDRLVAQATATYVVAP
ncbi:MAG: hotdog fold thioesterase [Acidimicrobiia bacterium]|nr:hotdog fold thioesterase [Acidimicrobiia bacterium]